MPFYRKMKPKKYNKSLHSSHFTHRLQRRGFNNLIISDVLQNCDTDISLRTSDNQILTANKVVLSMSSEFLKDILSDADDEEDGMIIVDYEYDTISSLLEIVYSGHSLVSPADVDKVMSLLELFRISNISSELVTVKQDQTHQIKEEVNLDDDVVTAVTKIKFTRDDHDDEQIDSENEHQSFGSHDEYDEDETNNLDYEDEDQGEEYSCNLCHASFNLDSFIDHCKTVDHHSKVKKTKNLNVIRQLRIKLRTAGKLFTGKNNSGKRTIISLLKKHPLDSDDSDEELSYNYDEDFELSEDEDSKEKKEVKPKLDKSHYKFECKICDKRFFIMYDLKKHVKGSRHKKKAITSDQPEPVITEAAKKVYPDDPKDDETIRRALNNVYNLPSNFNKSEKKCVCPFCGNSYCRQSNLTRHIQQSHPSALEDLKCEHCDFHAKLQSQLNEHYQQHHVEKCLACEECGFLAPSLKFLNLHLARTHKTVYRCEVCFEEFTVKKDYEYHLSRIHKKYQVCDICGHQSLHSGHLLHHTRIKHDKAYTVKCNECGKDYASKSDLKKHTRQTHLKVRYACEFCDYKAFSKTTLRYHIEGVHAGVTVLCKQCGKEIAKHQLGMHMTDVHKPKQFEKEVKCALCEKKFRSKAYLRKHKRMFHPSL